jgi:hypothetical protein
MNEVSPPPAGSGLISTRPMSIPRIMLLSIGIGRDGSDASLWGYY